MARPASEGPPGDGWVAAHEIDLRTLQEMKAGGGWSLDHSPGARDVHREHPQVHQRPSKEGVAGTCATAPVPL